MAVPSPKPLNPNANPYLNFLPHRLYFQNTLTLVPYYPASQGTVVTFFPPQPQPQALVPVYYPVVPVVVQPAPVQSPLPCSGFSVRRSSGGKRRGLCTTVMIRNIPNQFRRSMLVEFLDQVCDAQNARNVVKPCRFAYDFLYLPMDFATGDNLGYAFVNFTSTFAAGKIWHVLSGYKWGIFEANGKICESKKICKLNWAAIQGSDDLVRHFQNSRFVCDNDEYLPVLFTPARDGATSSFSPKTVGTLSGNRFTHTRPARPSLSLSSF